MDLIKLISISLIIILVANIILLGLGKISDISFWIIIIAAGTASFIIRKIRKPKL